MWSVTILLFFSGCFSPWFYLPACKHIHPQNGYRRKKNFTDTAIGGAKELNAEKLLWNRFKTKLKKQIQNIVAWVENNK